MAVDTMLSALADILPDYEKIRDCVSGQRAIKKKRSRYLPYPDESEPDVTYKEARYTTYLERAVFYGVTGRTLRGLVGLVFDRDPATEVPELLAPIQADASGSGTSLDQQASATLSGVVSLGRQGLLTDYPRTNGPTTRAQAEAGNIRPTILRYEPDQIINWRTRTVGAKILLSLVVIKEQYTIEDDGFAEQFGTQYRVLRLDAAGNYVVQIHRDTDAVGFSMFEEFMPLDGGGKPFREIPFTFVGAEDNDPDIDRPPLLDLAELNVAHYRNSADYEESCFVVGQPTPVFAGLTTQWVKDVFKDQAVRFGSRAAISLPQGGSAELLQAEPNGQAFEAMGHKEKQMVAIGAKLIENTGTQQTATEATIDSVMDNSVLGTCARNVSMAYRKCLNWAWQYATGEVVDDPEVIDYELSTDFEARGLTAADRTEIINEWQKGAITWEEMRWNLKRSGVAYLDDDEAKAEVQADRETSIENEAAAAAALAEATGGPNTPPAKDE